MRILLIEDDVAIAAPLSRRLREAGGEVTVLGTLAALAALAREEADAYDVVILDRMLPDGEGLSWLARARGAGTRVPVIVLTARAEVADRVLGLDLGADDYMLKPFEPEELIARVRARIRAAEGRAPARAARDDGVGAGDPSGLLLLFHYGPVSLDAGNLEASRDGVAMALTPTECRLLRFFMENPRRALARDTILQKVWGIRFRSTRTLDVHVLQLRQKLGADLIETVHGIGYRFGDRRWVEPPLQVANETLNGP